MLARLAKAAIYRPPSEDFDPRVLHAQSEVRTHDIKLAHATAFHNLTQWPQAYREYIHPTYVQVLSLPMQLKMMTREPFPFKALGLVHIANKINVISLPPIRAKLLLSSYFGDMYRHKRGIVFEIHTDASLDGIVTVKATSYYLARVCPDKHLDLPVFSEEVIGFEPDVSNALGSGDLSASALDDSLETFDFKEDAGRQYAKVSGDYNPIHLWPATARIFGFKRAIAHGMYSHALALSCIQEHELQDLRKRKAIKVMFKQAITLPSSCELRVTAQRQSELNCRIVSAKKNALREHLCTRVGPL